MLAKWLSKSTLRELGKLFAQARLSCELILPDGQKLSFMSSGAPDLRCTFHSWKPLRRIFDEFALAKSFIEGDIDIEGDIINIFKIRDFIQDKTRFSQAVKFFMNLFVLRATKVNKSAIDWHYDLGGDFFHLFIDNKHRFYSHGIFHAEDETIEEASTHKLERMFEALKLKPGMRLLDIGGGWGPVTEYCCQRGIKVSTVTIADDQYDYMKEMISRNNYDAELFKEDFLVHKPEEPYDAIVIFGVIEHIPRYRRFAHKVWECLRPGGMFFLDGSATHLKYDLSAFAEHYIWRGAHSFMCLQDVIQELLFHGMDLLRVKDETHDYELTMKIWAERFEAQRDVIVARWGEETYRAFLLYLWGSYDLLKLRSVQTYSLVARRSDGLGPRPSTMQRFKYFAQSLR